MSMADYGSPDGALLASCPDRPETEPGILGGDSSSPLWEYTQLGRIAGIPVEKASQGLRIENADMLEAAFYLDRRPRMLLVSLSPDDQEGQRQYAELLDRVHDGTAAIIDEERQFDAAHSRFIVLVRYNELTYRLHPRYSGAQE